MENSKSINEYYKDLMDWEKDISKRDQIVKGESNKNPIQINKKLIKNEKETENSNEKENENANHEKLLNGKENETDNKTVKLKRDVNSIKEYYKEWDKFKVDSDEEKSDSEKNDKPRKLKGKLFKNIIRDKTFQFQRLNNINYTNVLFLKINE